MEVIRVEAVGLAYHPWRRYSLEEVFRMILVRKLFKIHLSKKFPKALRSDALYYAMMLRPGKALILGGSKSDSLEASYLKLVFNATAIANIADNAASSPLTNLYVSLHTADPGEAGAQNTSEASYTNYARVAVVRTTSGWTVSGTAPTSVSPVANINFPAATGGSSTVTYFGVGSLTSG